MSSTVEGWDESRVEDLLLRVGDLLTVSWGQQNGESMVVVYEVQRQKASRWIYDWVAENSGFLPLGPFGAPASPGVYQSYFLSPQQLGVTAITNVVDAFKMTLTGEIYQGFIGVSPSPVGVIEAQPPPTTIDTSLEQNLYPQAGYIDVGIKFDGFESPLNAPSRRSEFFTFVGTSVYYGLVNPISVAVSPVFQFLINRLYVMPVTDRARLRAVLEGRIPSHKHSMGPPDSGLLSYSATAYGDIAPIPLDAPSMKGAKGQVLFDSILDDAGYPGTGG